MSKEWALRHVLLAFLSYPSPQNEFKPPSKLMELLTHCCLTGKLRRVTTSNARDMRITMEKLPDKLNVRDSRSTLITDFQVCCVAHVVNLAAA